MSKKKTKYYVVWQGNRPGVYDSWKECEAQVRGVAAARFKSFDTREEAEAAFKRPFDEYLQGGTTKEKREESKSCIEVDENGMSRLKAGVTNGPTLDALAVDAACSGNPGVMEYRGVYIATRTQVFHFRAEKGTNNIGEFLGIVHGLSYLKKHHLNQVLYSDSVNAINWVRQKKCKSKLPLTADTADLWDYVHRAESWLHNNPYTTEIRKWDTEHWGEIPADFGRK